MITMLAAGMAEVKGWGWGWCLVRWRGTCRTLNFGVCGSRAGSSEEEEGAKQQRRRGCASQGRCEVGARQVPGRWPLGARRSHSFKHYSRLVHGRFRQCYGALRMPTRTTQTWAWMKHGRVMGEMMR